MSDSNRPPLPPALEAVAACVEPLYATVMRIRNALYDKGYFATHSLGRPAVSVGNITAGGTGKTPVSIWLATKLAKSNHHPAVLLRGYKTTAEGISDEAEVLRNSLAGIAPVIVNRSRVRGAAAALRDHPDTTVFVLDDAMQHRGAKRNFDLVLINARNPFGFDRILPRGLLREPLQELRRASAVPDHSRLRSPAGKPLPDRAEALAAQFDSSDLSCRSPTRRVPKRRGSGDKPIRQELFRFLRPGLSRQLFCHPR